VTNVSVTTPGSGFTGTPTVAFTGGGGAGATGTAVVGYLANPVAEAVLLSQRCFWIPSLEPNEVRPLFMPDHLFTRGFIMIGISLVLVYLAQLLFTRLESNFAEHL